MRILHTIGRLCFGGMEGGVVKLLNGLDRDRFVPHLVSLRGFDEAAAGQLDPDVRFRPLTKRDGRDWRIASQIAQACREFRIDVVHSHNWETFLYSYLGAKLARVPVFIHGEHGRNTENVEDSRKVALLKRFLARRCDRLTTVSEDIAELLTNSWHVERDRISVISNGVDRTRFCEPADRPGLKKQLGFDPDRLLVGTVIGSIRPVKDLPTLLGAFAEVRDRGHDCHLAVVGDHDLDGLKRRTSDAACSEIVEALADRNLEAHVTFIPKQERVERYMQALDVYVSSSVYEGMSNTILEAMSCGAAIVATAVGGTPKIVSDRNTGLLVPARSAPQMAEAICELLDGDRLRLEISERGAQRIEQHHSLERFVAKHETIYEALLNREAVPVRTERSMRVEEIA